MYSSFGTEDMATTQLKSRVFQTAQLKSRALATSQGLHGVQKQPINRNKWQVNISVYILTLCGVYKLWQRLDALGCFWSGGGQIVVVGIAEMPWRQHTCVFDGGVASTRSRALGRKPRSDPSGHTWQWRYIL